jgi:hypothetical protein
MSTGGFNLPVLFTDYEVSQAIKRAQRSPKDLPEAPKLSFCERCRIAWQILKSG